MTCMMTRETVRLADLCNLIAEPVKPGSRHDAAYLGLEHLAPGRLTPIGSGQASEMRSNTSAFQPGDILYGKLRPYLDKAVLVDCPGVCTTELLVLRAEEGVDQRYLAAVVHSPSFVEHAVAGTTGVQHPRTSWAHIREFETPALSLKDQRQIAGLFWLIHEAIVQSERLVEAVQSLKRAALHILFTRGLRGEAQKETEIGQIPESWEPTTLASIATVKGGKRMPKGVPLTSKNTGQPYVRVTDFSNHGVKVNQILFVPTEYQAAISRYVISCNDVYISIAGTIGLVGQVQKALNGANLTENAARISVTENWKVTGTFLMYALAANACQTQIVQATATNAQPKLALARIEQIRLPRPSSVDEQREIVAILKTIDRKIELHHRKRVVLEELFKALLHKLMTGEIRVGSNS